MISWIQTNLEKHLKWVFIALLAVIIVSFVFTIGAAPGIGEPDKQANPKEFYGFNINDQQTLERLQQGVVLQQILGTEPMMMGAARLEDRMLARAALLHLAKELQIPTPDELRLKDYIRKQPLFLDDAGQFNDAQYQQFLTWVKSNPQFNEATVATLIDENFQIGWVL
ncbi:MAG TPA: SurA N-terminal domain-containing protein, partial [Opitutales bacterium]|nr:SurA N-terminal domain-containing protein [Opitutales bacterium]